MSIVTVAGANGQIVTLNFDTEANAALAARIAAAITAGVQDGTIVPATNADNRPPPVPSGKIGQFVQTESGATFLPPGYKAFVDTAPLSIVTGSGDADESVLSSIGQLNFFAPGGSGTVVAGGGNTRIVIQGTDTAGWSINTGKGNDQILITGPGNNTISAGEGHNFISLGTGNSVVQSTGADTITASGGDAKINAIGNTSDLIFGGNQLFYVGAGSGSATIFGGSGADTFFGSLDPAAGPNAVHAGSAGNNLLVAGAGNDTFFASPGNSTILGGTGQDSFVFTKGHGGSSDLIQLFASGQDTIDLQGYGKNEISNALKSQTVTNGSVTITLSDHTTITFAGVSSLSNSDFISTPGAGG
jgi:Ca2+-binding RTX toxin-like protein